MPRDFWEMTFHEVASLSMREEREERRRWHHTATVCALLANCYRGKNRRPYKPADFYPFDLPEVTTDMTREDIDSLINEFTNGN